MPLDETLNSQRSTASDSWSDILDVHALTVVKAPPELAGLCYCGQEWVALAKRWTSRPRPLPLRAVQPC